MYSSCKSKQGKGWNDDKWNKIFNKVRGMSGYEINTAAHVL